MKRPQKKSTDQESQKSKVKSQKVSQSTVNSPQSTAGTKLPKYIVPLEGSLGLLALGDEGLKAWREARQSAMNNEQ